MTKTSTPPEALYVGYTGALLILIGSVLPWVETGLISKTGTEGDGIITLILGLLSLGLVSNKKSYTYSGAIMGLLVFAVSGWNIYDIITQGSELSYELSNNPFAALAQVKVGIGLYLVAFGGLALVIYSSLRAKSKE